MSKDPAFLFYPGDYLQDTQTLSEKSQVAYDRIMCEHMRNICISKQQLKFFTKKLNDEELEELMFVLTEIEEGYQIQWVADSIEKRRSYSESRRTNRSGKTKKSDQKPKEHMLSYDQHMVNEIENVNESKGIERVQGEEGVIPLRRSEPALAVSPEFVKALALTTCELFNIEQINNARTWMDVHYFVKEVATDARKFEYLKSQTVWYKKLIEQGRPVCAVRNWISTYWNEQDYEKLWRSQNTTQFGTKKKANELTGSDFMEIKSLGR